MNRRNFFSLLTGALAALAGKPRAERKVLPPVPPSPQPSPSVPPNWGPGVKHPHWRVPQGRWVVDDPDKVLEWPTPDLAQAQRVAQPLKSSTWLDLKGAQLNPRPKHSR